MVILGKIDCMPLSGKGYIAKYKEVPDFREAEYHEGAKFLYDLKETEYEG